jgi:hypothetical protein
MAKEKKVKKRVIIPAVTLLSCLFSLLFTFFSLPAISYSAGQFCTMHTSSPRGPNVQCTYCHADPFPGYMNDNLDLASTAVCDQCHGPGGQFDGVNDAVIGAKANWQAGGVYDEETGKLKKGKEKWCVGCHDDGDCTILGVPAPNIAGLSVSNDWNRPVSILSSKVAGADKLIDGDKETGSAGGDILFDLGSSVYVSSVRLYTATATKEIANWEIWGGNDSDSLTRLSLGKSVMFASPTWRTQSSPEGEGWNEIRLDRFIKARYLKLVKVSSWPLNKSYLREIEFKKSLQYGYYVTGHKIRCENCHDAASTHIDGMAQTYRASKNNYQSGYRLKSVQVGEKSVIPMEIPRVGVNNAENPRTSNDFSLCFNCHDKYKLLGDAYGSGDFLKDPPVTNFRNDWHRDVNGKVSNEHLRHLRGRSPGGNSKDWDSDWDGTADSPQSCPACHNVHGSPSPVMIRHGELTSTPGTVDKSPMINLQYLDEEGKPDPGILSPFLSAGGQTQFLGSGTGSVAKNKICNMCHNDQMTYYRTPVSSPIANCQSCHTKMADASIYGPSHATHLKEDPRGPTIACTVCHSDCTAGSPHLRLFADAKPKAGTTACNPCHSKDGDFDGVNDPKIGAKANWQAGVFQQPDRLDLKEGLENWCAGCHDRGTSVCFGVAAPNVMGDNATYGYNINGHKIVCSACHDVTAPHTDGDARTYSHDSDPTKPQDPRNYKNGYRLKYGMIIPRHAGVERSQFELCFACHSYDNIMTVASSETNFFDDGTNRHLSHLLGGADSWDSDWDYLQTTGDPLDSRISCPACHNVHGAPNPVMIRHGELISTPGTQDKVPALGFRWYKADGYTMTIFGEESKYGDMPVLGGPGGGALEDSKVCIGCHGGPNAIKYDRDRPYKTLAMPTGTWARPPLPPSMRLLNPAPGSQDVEVDHDLSFILLANGIDDLNWNTFSVTIQGTTSPAQTYEYGTTGVKVDPLTVRLHQDSTVTIHPLVRFDDQERVTVTVSIQDMAGHTLTSPNWQFETGASSPLWRSPKAVYTESYLWGPELLIDDDPQTGNPASPAGAHWVIYDLGKSCQVSQIRLLIPCPQGRSWTISMSDNPNDLGASVAAGTTVKTNWLAEPGSITVDNPQATFTPAASDWLTATTSGSGYYGTNYQTHTAVSGEPTATCTWQISAAGRYMVYVRLPIGTDRIKDAAYTINYGGESDTVYVNQQANEAQWILLGTYSFAEGSSNNIVLSNASSSEDAESLSVVADAIRLIPEGTLPAWVSTSFTPRQGRYLEISTGGGPLAKDSLMEVDFAEPAP